MELVKLSNRELKNLSTQERIEYYKKIRDFYKENSKKQIVDFHKILHPICLYLMQKKSKKQIEIINAENKYEMLMSEEPVIFAVNHTNSHDVPVVCNSIEKQAYLLSENGVKGINRFGFKFNGAVFIERKEKNNRRDAKDKLIELVMNNNNIIIFPEGTWNMQEKPLMLELYYGAIDIAAITGAPIVPVVLEYMEDKVMVNFGEKMYVRPEEDRKTKKYQLRDTMASLKWEIFEKRGTFERKNIDNDEFKKTVESYLNEYPDLNVDYEESIVIKKYTTEEEVFAFLKDIELNKNNAFLAKDKVLYLKGKMNHD